MSKNIIIGGVTHQNVDRLLVQDADSNSLIPFHFDNIDSVINGTVEHVYSEATSMKNALFNNCTGLKSVSMPYITFLPNFAFDGCTSLKNINLPNLLDAQNNNSSFSIFRSTVVEKLNLPNFVGRDTFDGGFIANNVHLKNAVLPKCRYFTNAFFYGDSSLLSVYSDYAVKIDYRAFNSCESIEALVLLNPNTICTLNGAQSSFERSGFYIYVPRALVDTYKAATNWITYADHFRAAEDYPTIVEQCRLGTYGD